MKICIKIQYNYYLNSYGILASHNKTKKNFKRPVADKNKKILKHKCENLNNRAFKFPL